MSDRWQKFESGGRFGLSSMGGDCADACWRALIAMTPQQAEMAESIVAKADTVSLLTCAEVEVVYRRVLSGELVLDAEEGK